MPGPSELEGEVPKHRVMASAIAGTALTAAEHALNCCEALAVLVGNDANPKLVEALSQAERAAVYASNAVINAMTLARLEPEWLSE